MVSIIICSRKNDISSKLKENIAQTIGYAYELIAINNSHKQYNIFQAYNEGVRRSNGDILCFMHEDVLFHSKNWGNIVCDYFNTNQNIGCLGVAGGHMLLNAPSSYWQSETPFFHYYGRNSHGEMYFIDSSLDGKTEGIVQVAAVDGFWMCIRRSLFDTIRFDDNTFSGFHCYDSDICMQIRQAGYDIGIARGVKMEHVHRGTLNASYFESIKLWHQKWSKSLPVIKGLEVCEAEIEARTALVRRIVELEEEVSKLEQVRNSTSYKIGRFIITPIKKCF